MKDFNKRMSKILKTENRNALWCRRFIKYLGNKNNRLKDKLFLFNLLDSNNWARHIRYEDTFIHSLIATWTMDSLFSQEEKIEDLKGAVEVGFIKGFEIDEEKKELHIIRKNDEVIKVKKITDGLTAESEIADILKSHEREGHCHEGSLTFALAFNNDENLAIGYIHLISEKNKLLHSWIELKGKNNEEYCFDYTLNAVINKDAYYNLMNVKPINKILCKDLEMYKDVKNVKNPIFEGMDIRTFFIYYYDIMDELKNQNGTNNNVKE